MSRRDDAGQLWENFLIIERLKTLSYRRRIANRYFWRTYTGAEIDYVEESEGLLHGFEFTFGDKKKLWKQQRVGTDLNHHYIKR
jgi:predicted AAA+ superfamily ATPase